MSFALLFQYLMLNMFRMLVHPSLGGCDLFVELFHGLYCSGSMCVGVTVWFGWGGVVYLYSTIKHDGISHTGFVRVRTGKSVAFWRTRCCVFGFQRKREIS